MSPPSLTRPPRARRPPELVRHIDHLMTAYRRMLAAWKDKPAPPPPVRRPDVP